jgi:hypothetical protein
MKRDGAEKGCDKCGTWLYCRWKEYKNYPDSLQWQNKNGDAHYSYVDDETYLCNVEDDEK